MFLVLASYDDFVILLEEHRRLLQECLLALACDEWHYVASAASSSLVVLLSVDEFLKKSNGGNEGEKVHQSRCIRRSKLQKQAILNLLQRYAFSAWMELSMQVEEASNSRNI